jgi:flagellar hook assembly protein FlgD
VPRSDHVTLTVFDTEGRQVCRLADRTLGAGWHDVPWDAQNDAGRQVAGGVYYCQMKTDGFEKAIIMQLVK